jgi:hypothetical protein
MTGTTTANTREMMQHAASTGLKSRHLAIHGRLVTFVLVLVWLGVSMSIAPYVTSAKRSAAGLSSGLPEPKF